MESIVKVGDYQQSAAKDVRDMGAYARRSLDRAVRVGVEPGLAWADFAMVKQGETQAVLSPGVVLDSGAVYPRDQNLVLDLIEILPGFDQRIVVVAGRGRTGPTSIEPRVFWRVVEGIGRPVPEEVSTEDRRSAEITLVLGDIAVQPKAPEVGADRVAIAEITLSAEGIQGIKMLEATRAVSARRNAIEIKRLGVTVDGYAPQLSGLKSALTSLAGDVQGRALRSETREIKESLARIHDALNIPDVRVSFGGDHFLDERETDTTDGTLAARVEEGLRFPWAVRTTFPLAPLVATDTAIARYGSLALPAYTERWSRVAAGNSGILALNQFHIDEDTVLVAQMHRMRERYGPPFEVSTSSNFWNTGIYRGNSGPKSVFERAGERYQVYDTGQEDEEGHAIKRLRRIWADDTAQFYTTRQTDPRTLTAYQWAMTFTQPEDVIVTSMGLHLVRKPTADVPMSIGLCQTTAANAPDTDRMLTVREVPMAQWDLAVPFGSSKQVVQPTFLAKGGDYGFWFATGGDYWVYVADLQAYRDGTLFARPRANTWEQDVSKTPLTDLWVAQFNTRRTVLNLKPFNLPGGFTAVDILAKLIRPTGTAATFMIEDGGTYKALAEGGADALAANLETRAAQLVFTGTDQLQPMIDFADATVTLSRPAPALRHISKLRTLAAAARTVHVTVTIENFTPAKHTIGLRLIANGAEVAPTIVSDDPDPSDPKRVYRTASFGFAAPGITSFKRVVTGTTTDINDLCHVAEITDVCQAQALT